MNLRHTANAFIICSLLAIGGCFEPWVSGGVKAQEQQEPCPLIDLRSLYSNTPNFNLYLSQERVRADWHRARTEGVLDASYDCSETFEEEDGVRWVAERLESEAPFPTYTEMRLKSESVTIRGWRGQHWWVEADAAQVTLENQEELSEGYLLYRGNARIRLATSPGRAHLDEHEQGKRDFFTRFTDDQRLPVTLPVQSSRGWIVQDQEGSVEVVFPGHPDLYITSQSTDEGASLEETWEFHDGTGRTAHWRLKIVHRLFGGEPVTQDSLLEFVEQDPSNPCINGCLIPPEITSSTFRGNPAFLRRYTTGTPPSQDDGWYLVPMEGSEIAFFHMGKIVKLTVSVDLEDERSADTVLKEFLDTVTFTD